MSSTHLPYQRIRVLVDEGSKFLVVGSVGALITIVGAVALHGLGKYIAITLVTIAGAIVTFLGNRYWTFRHRQGQGATQESVVFFVLNGVGLLIYYACIWVIQDQMRLGGRSWYAVALVVGTGFGTLFRFWSYRKWVWTIRHQHRIAGAEFNGHADRALADGVAARPARAGGPRPASRPPGRARHASPRRRPNGRPITSGQPGAHRRT